MSVSVEDGGTKLSLWAREHYRLQCCLPITPYFLIILQLTLQLCKLLLFAVNYACTRRIKVIETPVENMAENVLNDTQLSKTHNTNYFGVQRASLFLTGLPLKNQEYRTPQCIRFDVIVLNQIIVLKGSVNITCRSYEHYLYNFRIIFIAWENHFNDLELC